MRRLVLLVSTIALLAITASTLAALFFAIDASSRPIEIESSTPTPAPTPSAAATPQPGNVQVYLIDRVSGKPYHGCLLRLNRKVSEGHYNQVDEDLRLTDAQGFASWQLEQGDYGIEPSCLRAEYGRQFEVKVQVDRGEVVWTDQCGSAPIRILYTYPIHERGGVNFDICPADETPQAVIPLEDRPNP